MSNIIHRIIYLIKNLIVVDSHPIKTNYIKAKIYNTQESRKR